MQHILGWNWFLVCGFQKLDEIPVLGLSLASVDE
jgi:hypothetical protein